ncbi:XRE family transcriptional regulator [Methylobacterium sp. GC_Met_2]|uniref:helix-turn-helix domain-containing protein n=1 Tax=Methylobacterium sp. GC_Met_2 TaxID=2937376 RepID=UPI0023E10E2E|nr:XRE family transcriptional regulator [Methylobacterium sp. GC_Met_2]
MQGIADTTQHAKPVGNVRPIRTPADHRWALAKVDRYFAHKPAVGTPDGDRLEVLLTLIAAADPVEILHVAITDRGRSQSALAHLLGSRARASEILNRKRALSLGQIRAISAAWNLPIALLAAPYRLEDNAA